MRNFICQIKIILLASVVWLISACGQTGPLFLPGKNSESVDNSLIQTNPTTGNPTIGDPTTDENVPS
jgi:predicted small lipoprotein YifL